MTLARVSAMGMLVLSVALTTFCGGSLFVACKDANAPTGAQVAAGAEAGGPAAEGVCQLVENFTGSTVVESICASLPEIATILEVVAPLIALAEKGDAGHARETCKVIPTTTVCATPSQLHQGIVAVVNQRRARLLVDAGLQ